MVCVPNAIRTTKPARALEVVCAYTTTYYFTGLNQARVAPVKTANGLRSLLFFPVLVLRPRHETSLDAIVRHHHTK